MASETCIACGEETAVGSVFYSDRHVVSHADGHSTYLCAHCNGRVRTSRRGQQLTDDEVRSLVENGSIAAIAWSGGGMGGTG
jgi:hypothetical protein